MNRRRRGGLTLIELLVVMTMLGVLLALLLPAVQKVRQASKREACAEKLMQIGLALYSYHDVNGSLPSGLDTTVPSDGINYYWYWSWMARILPYIGQEELWEQADDYARTASWNPWSGSLPDEPPGNPALRTPLEAWHCPADDRDLVAYVSGQGANLLVAFTDYQGVSGLEIYGPSQESRNEGLFFNKSHVRFADITNGLSNTLAVGERPPAGDLIYGWWFAGAGQNGGTSGSADVVLGIAEINLAYRDCPGYNDGTYHYQFGPGDLNNQCDDFHYWSLHRHGANFLLADGSAHFFKYTIDPAVLIAMAYRSGGPP
jgi:prepilin-type N-terminal cleavage/methylation domain-containing protein/prepilin-type processing-associated H-X9-DG protein